MAITLGKTIQSAQKKQDGKLFEKIVDLLTISETKEAVKVYNSMTTAQQKEYHRYLNELGVDPWNHWLAIPFTNGKELFDL